jgi:hypothetical protein
MAKPVIVTRIGKGSELTFQEGDDNFTNLRDATINVSSDSGSTQNIDLNGTVTIAGGTGITTAANNGTITVNGFDGNYSSLSNTPTLFDGQYSSLSGAPSLATVATSGAYSDLSGTPTIPTNNNELTNGAGYITGIASGDVTTALGFTPENSANKNANNGYAGLDSAGKVAAAQLPSYVDDVLEFADLAAFPSTGETGKIYVAVDNGKIYRWSGSAYIEISASPGSTDAVTEGSVNLYFTTQRARDAFSASTGITINNGAIATTITQYTDANARGALSAGTGISYDSATGVITSTASGGIASVSADTTPTLGGNLELNDFKIVNNNGNEAYIRLQNFNIYIGVPGQTTSPKITTDTGGILIGPQDCNNSTISIARNENGNITLAPAGTGKVIANRVNYNEAIHSLGTTSGTITPNVTNGNVQTITLNGNLTFSAFTSPVAGQSLTLIINTGGTGRTLTSTMKFAGGEKTLSTTNTTDIISVFYDGTNYWASLSKDFK